MESLFSSCLGDQEEQVDKLATIMPQPLKFRFANSVNLFDLILRYCAEPRKSEAYTFPRGCLHFLSTARSHVPVLYFPTPFPDLSLLIVYCHGSGSTLNNVYDYAYTMSVKYGVAVVAYDYSGEGESAKEFTCFEQDLKLVLAWTVRLGYRLSRTILCGFSLGSYSALCLQGPMPRILISPICGIISFFQTEAARYEGEKYDNVGKALELRCLSLVVHCSEELVHLSHGKLLHAALQQGHPGAVFHEITDKIYQHRSAPSFLCSLDGEKIVIAFLSAVGKASKQADPKDQQTLILMQELADLEFSVRDETGEDTKIDICSDP